MTSAAGLYGKSLYDLSRSEGLDEEIMQGISSVEQVFQENQDYLRLLSEPSLPKKERLGLLSEALGGSIHEYLLSFLMILVEKGLALRYRESFRAYTELYNKDRGIAVAVVYTAVELAPEQRAALAQALEKRTGKKIQLKERISPEVLGGIRVEVDGSTYDGTVMSRFTELRKQLSQVKI